MKAKRERAKAPRTKGAVALLRTGKDQGEIAAALGVSRTSITAWIACRWKPNPTVRKKIAKVFGIPASHWDDPFSPKAEQKTNGATNGVAAHAEPGPPQTAISQLYLLESRVNQLLADVESPEAKSHPELRSKILYQASRTLDNITKARARYDLGEQLFELPMWKAIERAILEALEPFNDARVAVVAKLRKLDQETVDEKEKAS